MVEWASHWTLSLPVEMILTLQSFCETHPWYLWSREKKALPQLKPQDSLLWFCGLMKPRLNHFTLWKRGSTDYLVKIHHGEMMMFFFFFLSFSLFAQKKPLFVSGSSTVFFLMAYQDILPHHCHNWLVSLVNPIIWIKVQRWSWGKTCWSSTYELRFICSTLRWLQGESEKVSGSGPTED